MKGGLSQFCVGENGTVPFGPPFEPTKRPSMTKPGFPTPEALERLVPYVFMATWLVCGLAVFVGVSISRGCLAMSTALAMQCAVAVVVSGYLAAGVMVSVLSVAHGIAWRWIGSKGRAEVSCYDTPSAAILTERRLRLLYLISPRGGRGRAECGLQPGPMVQGGTTAQGSCTIFWNPGHCLDMPGRIAGPGGDLSAQSAAPAGTRVGDGLRAAIRPGGKRGKAARSAGPPDSVRFSGRRVDHLWPLAAAGRQLPEPPLRPHGHGRGPVLALMAVYPRGRRLFLGLTILVACQRMACAAHFLATCSAARP